MSWTETNVEYQRHVRRSATADTIEAAFAFCLTGIDEEHLCMPVVEIHPVMLYDEDKPDGKMMFEASVSGHSHTDE